MEYPECVITINRKGEREVRRLLRRGEFVEYDYIDPETGRVKEGGKKSIILKTREGMQHYFLIPLKTEGRFLAVLDKETKEIKLWDGKKAVDV